MIEMTGLTRRFGTATAVQDLTLTVAEGEVLGLLGPNGAGKTTTVRMLAGLISRTSGEARVAGYSIGDPASARHVRGLIGLLPEEVGLYPDLSAARTLDFFGRLYRVPRDVRAERAERLLTMLGLWDRRDSPARTFSKGMKQRLALARALIHDPAVLFLDEPTANLDPEGARTVREFLLELRRDKRTIVLSTHQLGEAERVCDRVAVLRTRLIAVGTPAQLRAAAGRHVVTVTLEKVTEPLLAAARGLGLAVTAGEATLTAAVSEPAADTPRLVRALVEAGGDILSVAGAAPSLEDTYLDLMDERQTPGGAA